MEERMKVLWLSPGCSLQEESDNPNFTGTHERIMSEYCSDRVQLSVAYAADGEHESILSRGGITYYGVDADLNIGTDGEKLEKERTELLRIISLVKPDIIMCFGCERPYGIIAEKVDIPVVIHMMGFLNIYYPSIDMARGYMDTAVNESLLMRRLLRRIRHSDIHSDMAQLRTEDLFSGVERRNMAANRYFLGRTEWDSNIVRYYSPGSRYYHVEEAVKQSIYDAAGQWNYHCNGKVRLFSLSSADDRKGNEMILRTARILKEILGMDIVWKVAGQKDSFLKYERRTGIRHENVNIDLLGMIGSSRIIEEMRSADFFIHPSIMDNSPHAVCEAQLIGCPVIASNVGGVPDLIENGVTGFLYPYNEPHTLAFMIGNYCREGELLNRIYGNEVREAVRRHDPENVANALADAYEDIIRDYRNGQST